MLAEATVPVLVKLIVSVPAELVKVAKVEPLTCRLPPLTENEAPAVSKPNVSLALAPPLRAMIRNEPA